MNNTETKAAAPATGTATNPKQYVGHTLSDPDRQALVAAASAALPLHAIALQPLGTGGPWGRSQTAGRMLARRRAIRVLLRCAEIVLERHPILTPRHIEAALRSLALCPGDMMVDSLTGEWQCIPVMIQDRGEELARGIAELAFCISNIEEEGAKP